MEHGQAQRKEGGPRIEPGGRGAGRLKVFRTPIGFHDAYVAAGSQRAALEAWGSSTNLFTQGAAKLVTDPELTKAPLERPGEVVRVLRGSEGKHVRALGRTRRDQQTSPHPDPLPLAGEGDRSAMEKWAG